MDEYNGIKIGSIVTGYEAGYWKVLTITDRSAQLYQKQAPNGSWHPAPMVKLELALDSKGNRPKKKAKVKQCDISYCRIVTANMACNDYNAAVTAAEKVRDGILDLLEERGL